MENVKKKPLLAVACVAALLLVVGVLTFAGPCMHDDGSTSACFTASRAILAAGIVGLVASVAGLALRNGKAAGGLSVVAALAGAFACASPGTLFNLCMMQTMRCWTIMRPFALVCGAILCLCGLVAAIRLFLQSKGNASRSVHSAKPPRS